MKEPRFDFIHPPPYYSKQKWYPHKQPFNLYVFQILLKVVLSTIIPSNILGYFTVTSFV
jgi:hypothetical protein